MSDLLLQISRKVSDAQKNWSYIPLPSPPAPQLLVAGSSVRVLWAESALHDGILQALDGVDMSRLRICIHCKELFVAFNARSKTCSPRCSNAVRQREFYARNRPRILKLKRRYYQNRKRNRAARIARARKLTFSGEPLKR